MTANERGREIQARELAALDEKEANRKQALIDAQNKYNDYIKQNEESLAKNIEQIQLKAEADGVEANELEILNAKMQSYVSLIADSNGKVVARTAR